MRTRQIEEVKANKKADSKGLRSLFYTVPAVSLLLFTVSSPVRVEHTGVQIIESVAEEWSHVVLQECENEATLAHDRRVISYEERARKLENTTTLIGFFFGAGTIAAGIFSGGWFAVPVATIAAAELAWMQAEVASQLSSLTFSSSNQLRSDLLKCAEAADALEAELSVVDHMERTAVFDFQSGAILSGLVDIPNGRKTKTSATHLGTQ